MNLGRPRGLKPAGTLSLGRDGGQAKGQPHTGLREARGAAWVIGLSPPYRSTSSTVARKDIRCSDAAISSALPFDFIRANVIT